MRPPGIILLVCGGRDFSDHETLDAALTRVHGNYPIALLVQGGATGADSMAKRWALERGIQPCTFDACWGALGKRAGPVRNENMAEFLPPSFGVAFPGGSGTDGMCRILEARRVKVWRVPPGWRPQMKH